MSTKETEKVFVIASYEEDLIGHPVAYALGVEVAASEGKAYDSACKGWPDCEILPLLWEEVPASVRLQALDADREMP